MSFPVCSPVTFPVTFPVSSDPPPLSLVICFRLSYCTLPHQVAVCTAYTSSLQPWSSVCSTWQPLGHSVLAIQLLPSWTCSYILSKCLRVARWTALRQLACCQGSRIRTSPSVHMLCAQLIAIAVDHYASAVDALETKVEVVGLFLRSVL